MTFKKIIPFILFIAVLIFLIPYSVPVILALLTAIVLEPLVKFIQRTLSLKRAWSATISFVLFLMFFGLGCYWIVTSLVVQIVELAEYLPGFSSFVFEAVEDFIFKWEGYYTQIPPEYLSTIQQGIQSLENLAVNAASTVTKGIVNMVASLPALLLHSIVYLVAAYLFSVDLPGVREKALSIFSESAKEKVELILNQLSLAFVGFLKAQVILSLLTFVLAWVGLFILNVEYKLILSLLIVLVDILPILGTGSFLVPWAIYCLLTGEQGLAIGLVILFIVITVVRRAVEPKVLGTRLGISALATLISLYIGFEVIGLPGLIIGPALVIIYKSFRKAGFVNFKIDF